MGVWDGTIHAEIQVRDVPRAEDARLIYWTREREFGFFLEANMKISLAKYARVLRRHEDDGRLNGCLGFRLEREQLRWHALGRG